MSVRDKDNGILGIHHVTALASDPQANLEFYAQVLGLRLVKQTVNFDAPQVYHLYYGDELGRPGTILTFFPWPGAARGMHGSGQATVTAFRVPPGSLDFWSARLERLAVPVDEFDTRWDERVLSFRDPDGLSLELVETESAGAYEPWSASSVAAEHAVRGFHGVSLTEALPELTTRFLVELMGFELAAEGAERRRFVAGTGNAAAKIDLLPSPGATRGRIAAGSVHHVAWRVAGDEEQAEWIEHLRGRGVNVTPVRDRQYFRSIYFHEPGGVLFEIATDPPGFGVDEGPDALGSALRLPPWLEAQRAAIERALPRLDVAVAASHDRAGAERFPDG